MIRRRLCKNPERYSFRVLGLPRQPQRRWYSRDELGLGPETPNSKPLDLFKNTEIQSSARKPPPSLRWPPSRRPLGSPLGKPSDDSPRNEKQPPDQPTRNGGGTGTRLGAIPAARDSPLGRAQAGRATGEGERAGASLRDTSTNGDQMTGDNTWGNMLDRLVGDRYRSPVVKGPAAPAKPTRSANSLTANNALQPQGRRDEGRSREGLAYSNFRSKPLDSLDPDRASPDGSPSWGKLKRRAPGGLPFQGRPQKGPLDQLATDILGPGGDFTDNKPARNRSRDTGFDNSITDKKPSRSRNFQSEFEARVADLDGKIDTGRSWAGSDADSWAWVDQEKPKPRKADPVVGLAAPVHEPPTKPEWKKGRREVPAERSPKQRKPKPRRYSSFQEDDDEFDDDAAERAEERQRRKEEKRRKKEMELAAAANSPTPILLPEFISVGNLGFALGVKPKEVFLQQLAELGFEDISLDSIMTGETAALVAQEYGFEPTVRSGESVDLKPRPPPEDPSSLPPRPPIVTIMGHVDHGKTTMLDWLRKSSVAAGEHGGITQHIGAFSVRLSAGKQITFLDTPGHAAFLTMRERGAIVTDIVILVVAADDSVKPQTLEALKHARSAKVPIIVAINKVDKDEARVGQVKNDLARHGVELEDFGGDVQVVCVSGKTGQGMDDLEENILTLSEILDVRAEPDGMAEGWVLESSVKPIGRVATVLVKRGTLRKGDIILAGTSWARIRVLRNEAGVEVEEAPPGTPVEVLGWKELPDAGDEMLQAPTEQRAKEAARYREELKDRGKAASEADAQERREREKAAADVEAQRQEERGGTAAAGEQAGTEEPEKPGTQTVNFTVKGDVMGSVEAVCAAIMEVGNNEVRPRILRSAPGQITEFDVDHAATSNSAIINFNNPVPGTIRRMAEDAGVAILDHTIIYHLVDDVKAKLSEKLAPAVSTKVLGEAEVLQVFPINVKGRLYKNVAGCRVRNGQVTRNGLYRVMRKGEKVFDGKLESLKNGKKDVNETRKGSECGLAFDEWQDVQVGDQIQAYEEIREKRYL